MYPFDGFFVWSRPCILVGLGHWSPFIWLLKSRKARVEFFRTRRVSLAYFLQLLHSAVSGFEEIRRFGFASLFKLDAQLWRRRSLGPLLPSRNAFRPLSFYQTSRKHLPRQQRTSLTRQILLLLRCRARSPFLFAHILRGSWAVICLYDIHWTIDMLSCISVTRIHFILLWRSPRFVLFNWGLWAPGCSSMQLNVL